MHPTCDDTHSVARSPSGMNTVSTYFPAAVGNRYFTVPSFDSSLSAGIMAPTVYASSIRARFALDMLAMSAMAVTCLS